MFRVVRARQNEKLRRCEVSKEFRKLGSGFTIDVFGFTEFIEGSRVDAFSFLEC